MIEFTQKKLLYLTEYFESLDPLPLYREIQEPQSYPLDSLGPILAPAAKALHDIIKAPDAICAQSVLAATSLAAQPFANVLIDSREIPLSCFFITVAESGERKSAIDKIALQPIYDWQKMTANVYRIEMQQYLIKKHAWEARKKSWFQQEQNDAETTFEEPPPQPPLAPLMLVEEPTYEGIVKYLPEGQPSIGLFSDEGGRFLGGYAMNNDNMLKTISSLSSLWDGKPISRMRAGDGNTLLYGRRFAMHLMIQESILQNILSEPAMDHQGFLPRCLVSFPNSMAGKRQYVEANISKHPAIVSFWDAIRNLIDRPFPVNPPPAPQNELIQKTLILSPEAKSKWIDFHNIIDEKLAPNNVYHPIRRFASKAAEHAIRLAGTIALLESPNSEIIAHPYMTRAIELVNYYLEERLRLQDIALIAPELLQASLLLKWLKSKGYTQITLSECYQHGPISIRTADKARKTLNTLTNHGWITPIHDYHASSKRKKEVWSIKTSFL